jgi:hypothetical protein
MRATFNKGVVVDVVGDHILILDSDNHTVHALPLSYLDTVDALSQRTAVPNTEQLAELDRLGLVATAHGQPVSRRAMFVGAVALGATLAMPKAALASSETFFVGDDVFVRDDFGGTLRASFSPVNPVFTMGSQWTLTIDGVSQSANVDPDGQLSFSLSTFNPTDPGTVLVGRLSGANGALSNFFDIRPPVP